MFSNMVRDFSNRLSALYLHIATFFMLVLIFATFMQVFTRYVLNSSWPWTEEMARYSFIWMNMVGAAAGFRKGTLVAVDNILNIATGLTRLIMSLTIMIVVFVIGYVLCRYGTELVMLVGDSPSVTMRIPMGLIHAASPVSGFGFMVNALAGTFDALEAYKKRGLING